MKDPSKEKRKYKDVTIEGLGVGIVGYRDVEEREGNVWCRLEGEA